MSVTGATDKRSSRNTLFAIIFRFFFLVSGHIEGLAEQRYKKALSVDREELGVLLILKMRFVGINMNYLV